jgi:hypothetical protein
MLIPCGAPLYILDAREVVRGSGGDEEPIRKTVHKRQSFVRHGLLLVKFKNASFSPSARSAGKMNASGQFTTAGKDEIPQRFQLLSLPIHRRLQSVDLRYVDRTMLPGVLGRGCQFCAEIEQ